MLNLRVQAPKHNEANQPDSRQGLGNRSLVARAKTTCISPEAHDHSKILFTTVLLVNVPEKKHRAFNN